MSDALDELGAELGADPAGWARACVLRLLAAGAGASHDRKIYPRERQAVLRSMFATAAGDERRLFENLEFLIDTLCAAADTMCEAAARWGPLEREELLAAFEAALEGAHGQRELGLDE